MAGRPIEGATHQLFWFVCLFICVKTKKRGGPKFCKFYVEKGSLEAHFSKHLANSEKKVEKCLFEGVSCLEIAIFGGKNDE